MKIQLIKSIVLGALTGLIVGLSNCAYLDYKERHLSACDRNYKTYAAYMVMINDIDRKNGFGEHKLFQKEEFCKDYEYSTVA